jgi:4-oxalocrotonate tautomerase
MPLVTAKMFEGRLTPDTEPRLIDALTDAIVSVFGEELRDATWIVLEEIPRARWGVGGLPAATRAAEGDS